MSAGTFYSKNHAMIMISDIEELKGKRGKRSKGITALENEIVTHVPLETLKGLTLNLDTVGPLVTWEVTTLFHGTNGRYTYSVAVAMEPDRENKLRIRHALLQIMVKRPSRNSKQGAGRSTKSKTGKR